MKDDPTVPVGSSHQVVVESYVSNQGERGYVKLTWGTETGKLTPNEARAHALRLLEAADAAESDEFLFSWLPTVNITGFGSKLKVLREFRKLRVERAREAGRTDDI
jgi:hypothetical protein